MPKLKNSSAGHLEINLGINFQDQLKKVWNVDFWGQNSLHNVYNFWTNNMQFGRVPVVRFGSYFRTMNKIWFRKIFIPASRLYDLFEIPRSIEAARGRGQFWHPETRGSHLSTIYGSLNDLGIDWALAASSDLGFSKRSYSLEAGIKIWRNQILCILLKYEPNRTMGTPSKHTFFVQNLQSL